MEALAGYLLLRHAHQDRHEEWNESGKSILNALGRKDMETLRIYEKLLPGGETGTVVIDLVIKVLRRNGFTDVSFLSTEHVMALMDTESALIKRKVMAMSYEMLAPDRDPIMLLVMENMHRHDTIISLIDDRWLTTEPSLRAMLERMDEQHQSLAQGTL